MRRSALLFALAAVAVGVRAAGPAVSDLDVIRGTGAADRFARAEDPVRFEFPRDHGPHPGFRHEWWYVTGNLDSDRGERFGFELTFFRFALAPPAGAGSVPAGTSAWRTRQVYAAHFAITDVARGEFHFSQKRSRDALALAGAQADPFRVWLGDWVLGSASAERDSGASNDWILHADGEGYELTLDARPLLQPVLNGEQGLSGKSGEPGAASYYYSIPRVAIHGRLVRDGASSDVHGLAWLDREWGSGSLGAQQQGWDWFALQLEEGGSLMFYALRHRDGSRDLLSAGTWVDSSGKSRVLTSDQVSIEVQDHWLSPRGGRYPSRWRVRIPTAGLDLEVRPVWPDQELVTRPRYWEGAVDVRGTKEGRRADGRGYVELVGYGE